MKKSTEFQQVCPGLRDSRIPLIAGCEFTFLWSSLYPSLRSAKVTHVRLEPRGVLQDLRLQVPGLGRPRAIVDRVGEPVLRVVAPRLGLRQLREVAKVGAPAELNLGRRGERRAGGGLVPGVRGGRVGLVNLIILTDLAHHLGTHFVIVLASGFRNLYLTYRAESPDF